MKFMLLLLSTIILVSGCGAVNYSDEISFEKKCFLDKKTISNKLYEHKTLTGDMFILLEYECTEFVDGMWPHLGNCNKYFHGLVDITTLQEKFINVSCPFTKMENNE